MTSEDEQEKLPDKKTGDVRHHNPFCLSSRTGSYDQILIDPCNILYYIFMFTQVIKVF
jgi:hypothetical protein